MGRKLVGGEVGCYLSHKRCVSEFLASDYDFVIVLEDDLEIVSDLIPVVKKNHTVVRAASERLVFN